MRAAHKQAPQPAVEPFEIQVSRLSRLSDDGAVFLSIYDLERDAHSDVIVTFDDERVRVWTSVRAALRTWLESDAGVAELVSQLRDRWLESVNLEARL